MEEKNTCPSCLSEYPKHVFNCPLCEVILNPALVEDDCEPPEEPTLVQRMLSPPDGSLEATTDPKRTPPTADDSWQDVTSPTVATAYPMDGKGIPELLVGLDLREMPLTVFEAFVVSRIDGVACIDELRRSLELSDIELQVVVHTLKDKGILTIRSNRPAAAPVVPPQPSSQIRPKADPKARPAVAARSARKAGPISQPPSRPASPPSRPPSRPPSQPPSSQPIRAIAAKPRPENPLQKAVRLEQKGDLSGAIRVLEEAVEASRYPAPLYNRLAIVLIKERRDVRRAEKLLNRAIKADPNNETYQKNLAKVLCMAAAMN